MFTSQTFTTSQKGIFERDLWLLRGLTKPANNTSRMMAQLLLFSTCLNEIRSLESQLVPELKKKTEYTKFERVGNDHGLPFRQLRI
jgi:hypothetical protein